MVNYAASVSAKEPVWKYKWVENNYKKALKYSCEIDFLRYLGKCYSVFLAVRAFLR